MIDRIQGLDSALGPQADELKERALEYAASAREMLSERTDKVKDFVIKEPARALGVALGLGVLLGWLIKRR
jgi:ElaB/YqjD/DUF883 family membrane-anchored ribosome-binding protein